MRAAADLFAQIEARRAELGLSQAQLGDLAFGKPDSTAIQNLRRGASPSFERLGAIAEALGYEVYFGPPRETAPVTQIDLDDTPYAHIPLHDAELAAGDGVSNSGGDIVDALAFRRDWLKRIGVAASAARLVRVAGDSMEPTLRSGDMVMVDTARRDLPVRQRSEKDLRPAPIYALLDQGDARIKRVERPTKDHYLLVSDNRAAELRPAEAIELLGRVVWWGHTVRE